MQDGELRDAVIRRLKHVAGGPLLFEVQSGLAKLQMFVAGGFVRDTLIADRARSHSDVDLFLGGADVEAALAILATQGTLQTGPFGSPRWLPPDASEGYMDVIPIERFNNGLWKCDDITDALNQFDLTANAIAVDLRSGAVFDPQNGRRDIELGDLRCVRFDYPDEPIAPSQQITRLAVLWFRLLHYARILQFRVEPVTKRWLIENDRYGTWREEFERLFHPMPNGWQEPLE
jgi:hypothetical protein